MKITSYIALILFIMLAVPASSQVDSSFVYISHLTVETDSSSKTPFTLAIASISDTIVFSNQSNFQPIGIPKREKLDLLISFKSNVVKVNDIGSLMNFELWHYLNLSITTVDQNCVFATYWNENGEQISNNQIDKYLDSEGKLTEGVSCHYVEIGSYNLNEYSNNPPNFVLFGK